MSSRDDSIRARTPPSQGSDRCGRARQAAWRAGIVEVCVRSTGGRCECGDGQSALRARRRRNHASRLGAWRHSTGLGPRLFFPRQNSAAGEGATAAPDAKNDATRLYFFFKFLWRVALRAIEGGHRAVSQADHGPCHCPTGPRQSLVKRRVAVHGRKNAGIRGFEEKPQANGPTTADTSVSWCASLLAADRAGARRAKSWVRSEFPTQTRTHEEVPTRRELVCWATKNFLRRAALPTKHIRLGWDDLWGSPIQPYQKHSSFRW